MKMKIQSCKNSTHYIVFDINGLTRAHLIQGKRNEKGCGILISIGVIYSELNGKKGKKEEERWIYKTGGDSLKEEEYPLEENPEWEDLVGDMVQTNWDESYNTRFGDKVIKTR